MEHRKSLLLSIFDALFPETKVRITPWYNLYKENDILNFKKNVEIFSILCTVAYVLHYFFVDMPQNKNPRELWILYRFGVAALCIATYFLYKKNVIKSLHRIPYFLICCFLCFLQGETLSWHHGTPYQYGFFMAFVMAWTIQVNIFYSVLAFLVMVGLQVHQMLANQVPVAHIVSATIFMMVSVVFTRVSFRIEIERFLASMRLRESQQKNIELSIDFSNQLLAFLPKLIGTRLKKLMRNENISIAAASDLILKPRMLPVSCVYTDIRGYTKISKNLDYISKHVLGEIQAISQIVDDNGGIPRKVGDLVFAYYDSEDIIVNILNAVKTSCLVYEKNQDINATIANVEQINRKIIVTAGLSVVGNLGTNSSSIEITAMGPPVNLAARIDELTKNRLFLEVYPTGYLILSHDAGVIIKGILPEAKMYSIDLSELGLQIRDFEGEVKLWFLRPTEQLLVEIEKMLIAQLEQNRLRAKINILEAA